MVRRLLTVDSGEITFTFDMRNQASCPMIRLSNNTSTRVAFEVCSSSPHKYGAWPVFGVVSARSTYDVTVTLQVPMEAHSRVEHNDMIFIRSVAARADTTTRNASELFREPYSRISAGEDIALRVKHIFPPHTESSDSRTTARTNAPVNASQTQSSSSRRPAREHAPVTASTVLQTSLNRLQVMMGQAENDDLLVTVIGVSMLLLLLWLLNILPLIWSLTWFVIQIPIVIIMFVIQILIVIIMFVIKIPVSIFMFVIKMPMILVVHLLMIVGTLAVNMLREVVTDSIKDWIRGKIDRFLSSS